MPSFTREAKKESSLGKLLRCYGSVDRTQIDKIFSLMKIVPESREEKLRFLGTVEPEVQGAEGLLGAAMKGTSIVLGCESKDILKSTSSSVTDGADINTGKTAGLWTLFEKKLRVECSRR